MKPKHLKLIGALIGVAALLYLPRLLGNEEGRGSVAVEQGFGFSVSDPITRVDIVTLADGESIRLERGVEAWTVDGLRIDMSKVETLLPALEDLSSSELVARNPANHEELAVSETTGRRIEVYTESGGPATFHLGNRDSRIGGYFVRSPGEDQVFRLEGPAPGYLSRDRDGWRDRVIARTDTATVREIVLRRPEGELVLRRAADSWLLDDIAAEAVTVQNLVRMLSVLTTGSFPTDEEAAAADFSSPDAEVDVFAEGGGDVTGRELVLGIRLVLDVDRGDWLARTADGDEVYRLDAFAVRRLMPDRATLLPE